MYAGYAIIQGMVTTLLLLIIYLAFFSLGLPDGVMGVAWPDIRETFSMPLAGVGYLSVFGTIGAVISSFLSGHVLKRIGTGALVCISCALTGIGMLGYALSGQFFVLVIFCIPLGIGSGGVDSALNNYVAKHYTSRHMNWLHAFWGIGASTGPLIMTAAIIGTSSWRNGYFALSGVQLILTILFLLSLGLWKAHEKLCLQDSATPVSVTAPEEIETTSPNPLSLRIKNAIRVVFTHKGLLSGILTFFFYVGAEATVGLWSTSYFRILRDVNVRDAGIWVSIYYGSITVGRILIGFFVEKIGTRIAVRAGSVISFAGLILLFLPFQTAIFCPLGMCLTGLGFAPMYPCTMHDTPRRFGSFSPIATGYQIGISYIGYTGLPIIVGAVAQTVSLWLIPFFAILFLAAFFVFSEKMAKISEPVSI